MKRLAITTLVAVFALLAILGASQPAAADDEGKALRATLTGFEETPATLSSPGTGRFKARIHDHETMITFELHYEGLEGVTQAHIHLGRPAITGGIVLFLCTNLAPPAGVLVSRRSVFAKLLTSIEYQSSPVGFPISNRVTRPA